MSELYDRSSERRGFPGGLRAQLLLGLLLLVIGTVALVAIVVVEVAERQIRQTEIDRAIGVADHLAALHRADTPGQRLQSFRRRAGLSYAELSIDGRRFTSGTLPRGSEGRRPTGPSETHRIVSVEGQSYVLAMVRRSQDGHRVTARVARSLEEARERVERAWRLLWVYLALDALFVVVVGYGFLTFLVVRPIRAIGVATRRAARGDLASHIELLPSNEFGEVGRSFNAMLDELRENRRELEERLEELDRAYTELEQTQESLIRSEKLASVGQLAAGVAHEIGNPLSAISGYLEVLRDSDLDEQQREEILERAESQLDRIQAIIRDLLDYSREEADAPVQAVSLHAAVEDAIALVEPQPRARSLEIEECLPDELPEVRAHPSQLTQVLVNLLINAADAVDGEEEEGGCVELRATVGESEVRLSVADDGVGLDEEEQNRIFDPFYTTKEPGEGTGLGLAIAHRIMDRFGGDIRVRSEPGEGATFVLAFERADRET